ncbi:hypothetical protein [Stenotrophomonas indicatrix]|uniref:hypothetical protein n=1 Tax=Stenotrophomonas indicatrix TaxID=2045451 RepID=UPI00215B3E14|nr:hypothetical protein [Stenotrophomonas indicatrix]MCR8714760.1 hypothetical protein [Stenotrophomonas indicatrix]
MDELHAAFARFGTLQPQYADAWQGPFPLPSALATFYARVGPFGETINAAKGPRGITIPGVEVWIPPLHRLWAYQAGYRWNGIDGEPISDWPAQWLVIADRGADPLILDIHDGRVLFAQHAAGHWDAGGFAADVPTLMAALAAAGSVYLDAEEDLYSDDDDGGIRPVHREAALRAVAAVLGSTDEAERLLEALQ